MKISEIKPNQDQLNEGLGSTLFGEVPVAALKGLFTGTNAQHQLAQSIFLKDFYSDASISLSNGISSGLVDPSIQGDLSQTSGPDQDGPNSASSEPTAPTGGPTPPAGPANPQLTGPAAAKSLPPPSASSGALPAPTIPPSLPGGGGAAKALPAPGAGKTQSWKPRPNKINYSTGASQIPQTAKPNKVTYTPTQPKPASQQIIQGKSKLVPIKPKTTESKFNKLNSIFESIVQVKENTETAESISEYMLDWFGQYMTGVNWESRKAKVIPLIQNIEATYKTDKGKAAIKKLAQFALAISGPSKTIPAGAKNAMTQQSAPAAAPSTTKQTPEEILASMANLKKNDPRKYDDVQQKLKELPK